MALRNMGGESEAAWRAFLDDLAGPWLGRAGADDRRWRAGAGEGHRRAMAEVPVQRCTVHKHRNLLAHAPKKLYDEISADYTDMIYAETAKEVEDKRDDDPRLHP